MKLKKSLNNNVVLAKNDLHQEVVIFGNGISFKLKPGDPIDETKISKVFTLETKDLTNKMANLLKEVPVEYVELTEKIIRCAHEKLDITLSDYTLLTLTDHIYFAITRYKKKQEIRNVLLWEVKKFYKAEFDVGMKAIEIIKAKTGVTFNEDEAGFIAMHLVNTQIEGNEIDKTIKITKMVQDILGIIKYHFGMEFDEDSWNYGRLITHLKFFAQRIISKDHIQNEDDYLYDQVKHKYTSAFDCVEKIRMYVLNGYGTQITRSEMVYLVLHIYRVTNRRN
ncbi:beta-glucoside operon transcriptional antiterminator [Evansella caseinilytica]|uniref:Beta-glucoside operon transcriptional antiterminator n=1 Tax=Evansella caseinilytica TaxID=1503961 RepID=A0A1H3TFG9_9BACI|nr:PRD domain-containing protein [Evansella caseinilytica]SDZ48994.1 beta-glucoside operon transcriptional antiterminator [Evansella caseinilytica]